jgi:hypothetical protein
MENKYFTPDIEDVYVGYECEQLINGIWKNEIFAKGSYLPENIDLLHWAYTCIINESLRVPYLTKEQIEAEGWIKAKAPIVTINHDFYEIPYIKDNFRVDYNFRNNLINIIENNGKNLFYGKCKDINTFRKIIKLLGI